MSTTPKSAAGTRSPEFEKTPSQGNDPQAIDPWVAAWMPVLLHELNNQTQLLTGLRAVLELGDADELFYARADDLVRAGERTRDLGYAMAVMGSAHGADVLLARRDRRGLQHMLGLAALAASRAELDLRLVASAAPTFRPGLSMAGRFRGQPRPLSGARLNQQQQRSPRSAGYGRRGSVLCKMGDRWACA